MFKDSQVFCVLDFETYSEANLKKLGAFEYSVHPSTEIICAAWRIGTRKSLLEAETDFWAPTVINGGGFGELYQALMNPDVIMVAHNTLFEQFIVRNVFATKYMYSKKHALQAIPPERWICTASLAAAVSLPRSLSGAGEALRLNTQKDKEGHRLMLKWSKPRKPSKNDPATRHTDPQELARVINYCVTDIDSEVELFLTVPPLSPTERRVWLLDQRINMHGFEVDRDLVKTVMDLIVEETKILNAETEELTFGVVSSATKRDQVLKWLSSRGLHLADLQKKTVEDTLAAKIAEGDAERMLQIRSVIGKTSTAKWPVFEMCSRHDSRLRDILRYHAASTGRWGGVRIQAQNLPRSNIKDTIQAAEILKTGDLDLIRMIYGDPMNVFSCCLRNAIVAPKGHVLDIGDYATIEVRVLFWLADHTEGLRAFREGRDLYVEQASAVYHTDKNQITPDQRFVGKEAVLGFGFGMGAKKFVATLQKKGREISEELAKVAVSSYRSNHSPVVKLWSNIEKAAIAAVENPGKKYGINHTKWFTADGFLYCELPSGRRLAYYAPSVRYEKPHWGGEEKRPVLYHYGENSVTRKWVNDKTYGGKLVENITQATARDVMASAMLELDGAGPWNIVLCVHDELIAERRLNCGVDNAEFNRIMSMVPPWATGLPIRVESFESERYKK